MNDKLSMDFMIEFTGMIGLEFMSPVVILVTNSLGARSFPKPFLFWVSNFLGLHYYYRNRRRRRKREDIPCCTHLIGV